MPRGPTPPWRQLSPHTLECIPYVNAAIQAGYDKELTISGIPGEERAHFLRRGLYNAAQRAGVSLSHNLKKNGETYTLTFKIHDKEQARRFMIEKYGPDRQRWPYNPRRRDN